MLFNSVEFLLVFLPLVLAGFHLVIRHRAEYAPLFLIAASLVFYGYWDVRYVPLLLGSIAVNFLLGQQLIHQASKIKLIAAIGFNLALLGMFKYTDFFITTSNTIINTEWDLLHIILPLAISFFTFQQIAYVVDCYQGKVKQAPSWSHYTLFVSFFPQLIAGPIVHYQTVLPQFQRYTKSFTLPAHTVAVGLVLIIVGLFKKILIADTLGHYVDPAFANVSALSLYDAWVATLAYSLELYFDFSAYCEIALGLGLLFGIKLPINFDSPYKANTIQDFWRRWHITLGQFLKQYLYIPLGGNHHGLIRTALALILTMLLGGLWHGADWHYVIWGTLHGLMLMVFLIWREVGITLPVVVARCLTFSGVVLAWVMFRAESFADAMTVYHTLFGFGLNGVPINLQALLDYEWLSGLKFVYSPFYNGLELVPILALIIFVHRADNVHDLIKTLTPKWRPILALATAMGFVAFNIGAKSTFLYFQF